MSGRHGVPLRGVMSAKSSPLFQGRFGRMFRTLKPATFGANDADNIANLGKLAAAMAAPFDTPQLGPVGGRIVAEVFLGLMFGDPHSLLRLDPHWIPPQGAHYTLKDFVKYALGR